MSERPVVLVLGPDRGAVSGVSTHLNLLFGSRLCAGWTLEHFQVGSEGRPEGRLAKLGRLLSSPLALAVRLASRNVDIVHINTSLEQKSYWRDLAYLAVAKMFGARVLYQVHGGALPREFFPGSRLLTGWLRATLKVPDLVVLLAQCEIDAYREFLPQQQLVAVPNAIDLAPYEKLARTVAADPEVLRLVYVGRLAAAKGLFESLEAIKRVRDKGLPVSFAIAGSGPDEDALRRRVEALQLSDCVTFAGALFDEPKLQLFAQSDVFLFPTYHREGLPYALLESMAAGTPVISTRVGAIPDVMQDGVHGVFVTPRDPQAIAEAIERLHGERSLLARMGEACRSRVASRYSVEHLAEEFSRQYARLAPAKRVEPAFGAAIGRKPE